MQPGLANLISYKGALQGHAQSQGCRAVLVNGAANAQAQACQNAVLVVTLTIAIDMTIIKEGEGIGVSINHRY